MKIISFIIIFFTTTLWLHAQDLPFKELLDTNYSRIVKGIEKYNFIKQVNEADSANKENWFYKVFQNDTVKIVVAMEDSSERFYCVMFLPNSNLYNN